MTKELEYLKDKIVLFDVDGTLMRYDFGAIGKCFTTDEWIHLSTICNIYTEKGHPTSIFNDIIRELGNNAWVITVSLTLHEQRNKIALIKKIHPTIPENHILFVGDTKYKVPYIESLIASQQIYENSKEHKKVVLVDDKDDLLFMHQAAYGDLAPSFEIRLVSDFI